MPDKANGIAYLNEDHPNATDGAGYYEVRGDDHGNPNFGAKLDRHPQDDSKPKGEGK